MDARPGPILRTAHQPGPDGVQVNILHFFLVLPHRAQRTIKEARLQQSTHSAAGTVDAFRRGVLNRLHYPADGERMRWIEYGMPRRGGIRQEHPEEPQTNAKNAYVCATPLMDHLRQTGKF